MAGDAGELFWNATPGNCPMPVQGSRRWEESFDSTADPFLLFPSTHVHHVQFDCNPLSTNYRICDEAIGPLPSEQTRLRIPPHWGQWNLKSAKTTIRCFTYCGLVGANSPIFQQLKQDEASYGRWISTIHECMYHDGDPLHPLIL